MKNFSKTGPVWLAGIINEKKGPLNFHIELADGCILRRHMEHIQQRMCKKENKQPVDWDDDSLLTPTSTSATTPVDNNPTVSLQPTLLSEGRLMCDNRLIGIMRGFKLGGKECSNPGHMLYY